MKIIGTCKGVAARTCLTPEYTEIFKPGCFSPMPSEVPLLYRHDGTRRIGTARVHESPNGGIEVTAEFQLDTTKDPDIFRQLQAGALKAFSIGFELHESYKSCAGIGPRVVEKAVLTEVSLTPRGGNPTAVATSIDWRPATYYEVVKEVA